MKSKILPAVIAAGMATASHNAFAVDGTITFNGNLTSQTCQVGSSVGGNNFIVTLPSLSATALNTAGQTAGETSFSIVLSNCTTATGQAPGTGTGTVRTYFETGPINGDGRLTQTATGPGAATGVDIQLLNGRDRSVIRVGNANSSSTAPMASGAASLPYIARYFANAAATPGTLASNVTYSIIYQ